MKRSLIASFLLTIATIACRSHYAQAPVPDPITEWSTTAQSVVAASGMAPLRTPITFAMLHLAMYDAVNAIVGDREPYAVMPPVNKPASPYAAAVEAGYRVLLVETPSQQAVLHIRYVQLRDSIPDSPEKINGAAVGAAVAERLLLLRANDGRNINVPYVPRPGAGVWAPTPPAFLSATTAFLARTTPFTMENPGQFRPKGPPALNSRRWARITKK